MKNYAGRDDIDKDLEAELTEAGIGIYRFPEFYREKSGEVKTIVIGTLYGWTFKRAWYYWIAEGPGIPPVDAEELHQTHGKDVRVDGHCGCPSPTEWYKGFAVPHYHIDTQEGLNALAAMIQKIRHRSGVPISEHE